VAGLNCSLVLAPMSGQTIVYPPPGRWQETVQLELTEKYRRVLGFIVQAADERDLYAMKSLHYEKLGGGRTGQRSLRLNRQWRLIVRVEPRENQNTIVVVEIVDYH